MTGKKQPQINVAPGGKEHVDISSGDAVFPGAKMGLKLVFLLSLPIFLSSRLTFYSNSPNFPASLSARKMPSRKKVYSPLP